MSSFEKKNYKNSFKSLGGGGVQNLASPVDFSIVFKTAFYAAIHTVDV